jgi:hypothetical protein
MQGLSNAANTNSHTSSSEPYADADTCNADTNTHFDTATSKSYSNGDTDSYRYA